MNNRKAFLTHMLCIRGSPSSIIVALKMDQKALGRFLSQRLMGCTFYFILFYLFFYSEGRQTSGLELPSIFISDAVGKKVYELMKIMLYNK